MSEQLSDDFSRPPRCQAHRMIAEKNDVGSKSAKAMPMTADLSPEYAFPGRAWKLGESERK